MSTQSSGFEPTNNPERLEKRSILDLLLLPGFCDHILGLRGMSPTAINLWMSGNSLIRRRLTSLTLVELVNHREFAICGFPRFLESLHSLRSLTIDRGGNILLWPEKTKDSLQRLNPGLTELKLFVRDSRALISLVAPTEAAFIDSSPSYESIASSSTLERILPAFPYLDSLALDSHSFFRMEELCKLPPCLTSLSVGLALPKGFDESNARAYFEALPRNLARLEVQRYFPGNHGELLSSLPPHLIELGVPSPFSKTLSATELDLLPKTLTRAYCCSDGSQALANIRMSSLASLPRGMTSISSASARDSDEEYGFDFGRMFPQLRSIGRSTFEFTCTPSSLRSLPTTTTSMIASLPHEHFERSDWPESLTKLSVTDPFVDFDCLPSTLKYLTYRGPVRSLFSCHHLKSVFGRLPDGLTSLTFTDANFEIDSNMAFPPGLTHLSMDGIFLQTQVEYLPLEDITETHSARKTDSQTSSAYQGPAVSAKVIKCFPFALLPQSITALYLETSIPASMLGFLPRRLSRLSVGVIFQDAHYNAHEAIDSAAVSQVWEAGGYTNPSLFESLSSPSRSDYALLIATLPRTLEMLTFDVSCDVPRPAGWFKYLPPYLTHLEIGNTISEDFVYEAPISGLKQLRACLERPTDEHILALPRRLVGHLKVSNIEHLTPKSAIYWPRHLGWAVRGEAAQWHEKLDDLRKRHMTDSDPTKYLNLLKY